MGRVVIEAHMSRSPVAIGAGESLAAAHRLMRDRGIRHLPVLDGGRLVGVVSQGDLFLAESVAGVDPATETVREAMSGEPYAVAPGAALEEVAATMAERRLGSAIVVDRGAVIGVFTTVDALRALASLAGGRRPRPAIGREGKGGR